LALRLDLNNEAKIRWFRRVKGQFRGYKDFISLSIAIYFDPSRCRKAFGTGLREGAFDEGRLRQPEGRMTNRSMVKDDKGAPKPNPTPPTLRPAPESDDNVLTTREPLDSPQPKPMIRQDKTKGLRKPSE
jgi:hypothetical protein